MDWQDEGLVLLSRPHGEGAAIVELFTALHGRHAGVVRGGASRRMQPALQPGTGVQVAWRARLADHMGHFTIEPVRSRSALLSDRLALAALNCVTALLHFALPERDPHPALYHRTLVFLDRLEGPADWTADYLDWEVGLLEELGYGLDLGQCAVTGATEDLAYVSPRSGRAVSRAGAGGWADRLLPLPPCLLGFPPGDRAELMVALATTGWFLDHRLAHDLGPRPLPEARRRLVDLLARGQ
jgi:DNA repair protein RecO (recombination protein O)